MSLSRFLAGASAALIAVSCAFPVVTPGPSAGPTPASGRLGRTESRILGLINAERLHRGLPALVYDDQLNEMATIQAKNMARFQKMAHVLPGANLPTLNPFIHVRRRFRRAPMRTHSRPRWTRRAPPSRNSR